MKNLTLEKKPFKTARGTEVNWVVLEEGKPIAAWHSSSDRIDFQEVGVKRQQIGNHVVHTIFKDYFPNDLYGIARRET